MKYILFINADEDSDLYDIFIYLDKLDFDLQPEKILYEFEDVVNSPTIYTENNDIYIGETECIRFLSWQTNIMHLRDKSKDFVKRHPNYIMRSIKIKID